MFNCMRITMTISQWNVVLCHLVTFLVFVESENRFISSRPGVFDYRCPDFQNPASAHKRLLPPISAWSSSSNVSYLLADARNVSLQLNATYNDPVTEHAKNVEVLPYGLRALLSGSYLVYSSVHFVPDITHRSCSDYAIKTRYHGMVRRSSRADEILQVIFHTNQMCCDGCQSDEIISYTGGRTDLQKGDLIQVEASFYGLISFRRESTFVGLFKLDEHCHIF